MPYEAKCMSLPVEEADDLLKKWEDKEEPSLSKKRPRGASDNGCGAVAQRAKFDGLITTYGPDFKRAVNVLFCHSHGREPKGRDADDYIGLITRDAVQKWDEAVLPLVAAITAEDRRAAAGYAIRASLDLYSAYMFANADPDEIQSYAEYFQQKNDIINSLRKVGGGRYDVDLWEEAIYVSTRDGPVQDIYRWKWRLYAVDGMIRRRKNKDAAKARKDLEASKEHDMRSDDSDQSDEEESEDEDSEEEEESEEEESDEAE